MDALTFYPQCLFSGLVVLQWALMRFRRQLWIWDFYFWLVAFKVSLGLAGFSHILLTPSRSKSLLVTKVTNLGAVSVHQVIFRLVFF